MDNMNVADIIQQAFQGRPQGVEDAFNNVIQQKMAAAIEARRQEIAQTMFGDSDDYNEEEVDDESEFDEEDLDSDDQGEIQQ